MYNASCGALPLADADDQLSGQSVDRQPERDEAEHLARRRTVPVPPEVRAVERPGHGRRERAPRPNDDWRKEMNDAVAALGGRSVPHRAPGGNAGLAGRPVRRAADRRIRRLSPSRAGRRNAPRNRRGPRTRPRRGALARGARPAPTTTRRPPPGWGAASASCSRASAVPTRFRPTKSAFRRGGGLASLSGADRRDGGPARRARPVGRDRRAAMPADHLAIELALTAHLVAAGDQAAAAEMIRRLVGWIPAFADACGDADGDGFWAGAAAVARSGRDARGRHQPNDHRRRRSNV